MSALTMSHAAVVPFTAAVEPEFITFQNGVNPVGLSTTVEKDRFFSIGSCHGGGVIFYLSPITASDSEQHGLIAALEDANEGCTGAHNTCYWDKNGVITSVVTEPAYFTGLNNTNAILNFKDSGTEAANAANNFISVRDKCRSCSNWFLPSQDELTSLVVQAKSNLNLFWLCNGQPLAADGSSYWSSTQLFDTANGVWRLLIVGAGVAGINASNTSLRVRAIRAF